MLAKVAMLLYWALLLDLTIFSMQISVGMLKKKVRGVQGRGLIKNGDSLRYSCIMYIYIYIYYNPLYI